MIFLIMLIVSGNALAGGSHHHDHHDTTTNTITTVRIVDTNGLAAIHAAAQIHPSLNVSGIQLGAGIAQANGRTGLAAGAAYNVKGWALFNGSVAKEGDDAMFGFGFNVSLKP